MLLLQSWQQHLPFAVAWHAPAPLRRPAHGRLLASWVASTISLAHCKLREKPHTLEHLLVPGFGCGKEGTASQGEAGSV